MTSELKSFTAAGALAALAIFVSAASASALGLKDCAAKYNTAKAAGTLGAQTWNEFRKAQCAEATKAAAPVETAATTTEPQASAKAPSQSPTAGTEVQTAATFPASVAQQFLIEKPAKARMHTCLAQYKTNKPANANGGLRWIEKGGGYYSQCNKRLKGESA